MTRSTFLPFSPPDIGDAERAQVMEALNSGWITTGPKVKRFEEEFAAFVGAPAAAAVNSCTAATIVSLAACGIGAGDAVITTTMTFVSTVHVIEQVGATPILVDIDPYTLNLDPRAIDQAIKDAEEQGLIVRAVIPVHFAGLPCDMSGIFAAAQRHNLAVIEDAAHSLPASFDGRRVGSIDSSVVNSVAFSFYATKNLTTGEGGMITGSEDFIEEARLWVLHGMSRDAWKRYGKGGSWKYDIVRPGFKCNMTDLAGALGLAQLPRLEELHQRRLEIAKFYDEALVNLPLAVPPTVSGTVHARHLYPIQLDLESISIGRDQVIDELSAQNIGTSVHFIPVHHHSYYREKYDFLDGQFPNADRIFATLVSIPLNTRMTDEDAQDVVDAVTSIFYEFAR
jgi:dTDP-4-amino-4,6-dideoxygalactose transaminase